MMTTILPIFNLKPSVAFRGKTGAPKLEFPNFESFTRQTTLTPQDIETRIEQALPLHQAKTGDYILVYGLQGAMLRQKGMLGGPTYIIKGDGSVRVQPVLPGVKAKEILPAGSVNGRSAQIKALINTMTSVLGGISQQVPSLSAA